MLQTDPTAHSELLAVRDAARRLGTRDLSQCEVYSTANAVRHVPGRSLLGACASGVHREHAEDRVSCRGSDAELAHVPEKWRPVFRKGHAPIDKFRAHPGFNPTGMRSGFVALGSRSRLRGGGMTGVLPPPGGGVTMSKSTLCGGQMTPSDLDNFSLKFVPPWPCVSPIERFVGSISVEQFCWPGGMTSCADGRRSCAPARATIRIQTGSAAKIPANEIGFMPRSSCIHKEQRLAREAVPFPQCAFFTALPRVSGSGYFTSSWRLPLPPRPGSPCSS